MEVVSRLSYVFLLLASVWLSIEVQESLAQGELPPTTRVHECSHDQELIMHDIVILPIGSPRITYITPRRGSIAGGTKVTAYGSGFATDAYTSSNFVFLGSVPCLVQP